MLLGHNFTNNLENVIRSEKPRHKISILWHSELFDMFLHWFPKTALKNTQNLSLYSILKLTFPEIFKNESFRFSQFSWNFVSKKRLFYGTLGFFICFSVDPRKPHSIILKTTSLYSLLKLTLPEIFKNKSFHFSQFFRNFV